VHACSSLRPLVAGAQQQWRAVSGSSGATVQQRARKQQQQQQQQPDARSHQPARARRRQSLAVRASAEPVQVAWVGPEAPRADAAVARRVVAVIDHSRASARAVSWAVNNLYRPGDVLHLLHVVPPASAMANGLTAHTSLVDEGGEDVGQELVERTKASIERALGGGGGVFLAMHALHACVGRL